MDLLYFDAIYIIFASTVGIVSGWSLNMWRQSVQARTLEKRRMETDQKEKVKTKELMTQLQTLATSVASQVGEHSSRVQEINDELTTPEGQKPEFVMAAINKLVEANDRMHEQLVAAERRLEEKSREIESRFSEARTDALTEINNRRAFDEEMTRCMEEYQQQGRPSCVMMLDVDFFKKFNDAHGHKAGDEVLKHVAKTLKNAVSKAEIVCRYGGEEFAIIFPGSTLINAKPAAERARAAIGATKIEFEGRSLRVTASGGLAEFQRDESIEEVLKRADDALYHAKKSGRNCGYYNDGSDFVPFVPQVKIVAPPAPAVVEVDESVPPNIGSGENHARPEVAESGDTAVPKTAAVKDPETGLSNKVAFYEDIVRRLSEWKRGGSAMSIVFMEIDNMDRILAENGPGSVALIVKAGAQFLKATCRDMDHISRYDDNMFSMLLPTARLQNAATIAERLRKAVAKCRLPYNGTTINFTVSFGVAEAIQGDSASRLVHRGGAAVRTAANQGGNRTFVHNGERAFPVTPLPSPVEA